MALTASNATDIIDSNLDNEEMSNDRSDNMDAVNDDVLEVLNDDDISDDDITVIIRNEHRLSQQGSDQRKGNNEAEKIKKKRKNVCGAERNRRRKAKLALSNSNPALQSAAGAHSSNRKRGRSPNREEKVTPPSKKVQDTTPPVTQSNRKSMPRTSVQNDGNERTDHRPEKASTFNEVVADSLTHYVIGVENSRPNK